MLLGLITQTIGTWVVAQLLSSWGVNPWYALVYGLWAGFTLAVRLDLPEPLAYGLVAGSLLAHERGKSWMSCVLLGLSVFAKEVTMLFVLAAILASIASKRWRDGWCMALITVLPYALFQVWLWRIFGEPGIGSGGAMATSFEIIPLKGFLQIGAYSLVYLLAMLVVFGPSILLPAIWGVWAGLRRWVAGDPTHIVFALLLNAIIIFFLPFSTVRETGGLLRFASGLVLSVLLFAARYRYKKVLNYSALWLVMNTFLLKS